MGEDRGEGASTISLAPWPEPQSGWEDPRAEEEFKRLQAAITEVRNIRALFRVPVKQRVKLLVRTTDQAEVLTRHEDVIRRLGTVEQVQVGAGVKRPAGSVVSHLGFWEIIVPLAGLVDLDVERRRIEKEARSLEERVRSKRSRLGDAAFRSRAPADVVAEEEESLRELERELARWQDSLKQLG